MPDKVRTIAKPSIFYYNPSCEMAVGNGLPHYRAPALVSHLEKDLSFLMSYLASANDWVLVSSLISDGFKRDIVKAGFPFPTLVDAEQFFFSDAYLNTEKKAFVPWGISPAVLTKMAPHLSSFDESYRTSGMSVWKDSYRKLFSRETALEVLSALYGNKGMNQFLSNDKFPVVCRNLEMVGNELKKHRQIILKAPWSSSGRGSLVLIQASLNRSNKQWISGILQSQGRIMCEALLPKVIDFSFHFNITEQGVEPLGSTCFETNQRGQYIGSYLETIPDQLARQHGDHFNAEMLNDISTLLQEQIAKHQMAQDYRGVLGVDAMLCNDAGKYFIHPCVEINLRNTMGTITLALRNQFPHAKGFWKTIYSPKGQLGKLKQDLMKSHPVVHFEGNLKKGFLPLTPMEDGVKFASYLMLNTHQSML